MWQVNKDVLVTDLADELVLLHPAQSEMYSLNSTGRVLWQALPATLDGLVQVLVQEFGIPEEQARQDVVTVLEELRARELVRAP